MNQIQTILHRVHCLGCKGDCPNYDKRDKMLDVMEAEREVMEWTTHVIGAPNVAKDDPCYEAQAHLIRLQRVRAGL